MKTRLLWPLCGLLLASALIPSLHAQGTAFTYQGRLTDNAGPATGTYDLQFSIHDAASGGHAVAGPILHSLVQVTEGLFTATLDFGAGVFIGDPRWLEIAVRTNGAAAFTTLEPRQPLAPTPYALYAPNAGNALFLDGQSPKAYAPAAGSPAYVAKTGDTMTGPLAVNREVSAAGLTLQGNAVLNDHILGLRSDAAYHGLGWFGPGKPFSGTDDIDGPILYGWGGGGLGTTMFGQDVTLQWDPWGWVGIAGGLQTPAVQAGSLSLQGDATLNDHVLRLRSGTDLNHGLGWCGPGHSFAGRTDIDGPVLYGYLNGALGTKTGGEKVVLQWNQWGWVDIAGGLQTPDVQVTGTTQTGVLKITGGADVAEPFALSGEDIPKGAVVVIDEEHPGQLKLSERAYDTRVAGIVSGANGVQPGLTLNHPDLAQGGRNVALSGRVYVQAETSHAPIKPGDLLTTSDIPGHAMKVTDHAQAQGAILGKAMSGLKEGRGLVLVLVSLQ